MLPVSPIAAAPAPPSWSAARLTILASGRRALVLVPRPRLRSMTCSLSLTPFSTRILSKLVGFLVAQDAIADREGIPEPGEPEVSICPDEFGPLSVQPGPVGLRRRR